MSNLPDLPAGSLLDQLRAATSPESKLAVQRALVELVDDERFPKPVPAFMVGLPFIGTSIEQQLRIGSVMFTAADPDAAQAGADTVSSQDLVGKTVTVWDLKTAPSDKESPLGAYLLLDVTEGDDLNHRAANTGAPAAMIRLATAWVFGRLPLTGAFALIPGTGARGNPAVTFMAETPLG
jgi:hypothetical protein